MDILYLSTKLELDRFTNNPDLSSDRKDINTNAHAHTSTLTKTDTLRIYHILSSNYGTTESENKKHDLFVNS